MKNRYIILIILFLSAAANAGFSSDFYPELGMDPFYSSLNPAYTNEDFVKNDTSVFSWFKNKFKSDKKSEEIKNEPEETEQAEPSYDYTSETKNTQKIEEIDLNTSEQTNNLLPVNDEKKDTLIDSPRKKYASKKELEKALREEERENKKLAETEAKKLNPEPSVLEKLFFFKKSKKAASQEEIEENPALEMTADSMEYYPERYEVEAVGNAKVNFIEQGTILTADKITFNYDRNILKASQNVVLTSKDSTTEGDYIRLDLTNPDGWIENPITTNDNIKITAKEAFVYQDKIEELDGVAKILNDEVIRLGAASFAGYVDQSNVLNSSLTTLSDENKGAYTLKAKTIYIDAKDEHDTITIKNADVYFKNHKVAVVPSLKIVTNKKRQSIETNLPEFGSESMLGTHIGPAVVLNVPGGSTLKLAPIVTYAKDKVGLGGIARFRNEYNMTEAAYGTSRERFLLRGKHKVAPGLMLNYSSYTNQNEWFLGYRMPKYSAQLNYSRHDYVDDLKLNFSQMYSAGVFVDKLPGKDFKDAEGRFRWMTQTQKPLFTYTNEEGNLGLSTGLVAQTASTAYTTGDVLGLFRIGPFLSTKAGPWNQSVIFYETATAGDSPFDFDRYRYGRSNLVLIESLKLCKYVSVGYLASIAMNRDVKSDDSFQENRVILSLGPDYAKVIIGYDSLRRSTMFLFSMLLGMEDSEVEFKKTVLKNPEKFGREKQKTKKKKKNYKKYLKEEPNPNLL